MPPTLKSPKLPKLPDDPPARWPKFTSPLRSVAVTARVGRVLGICFVICFVTGMLSHYQYHPWFWLPEPATPVWGYRVTQGVHVLTGIVTIPLLLVKLWSVYPKLFVWPPVPRRLDGAGIRKTLERLSIGLLVGSALVELVTGFLNVLNYYPWPWDFVTVHRFLGYVVIGSILLHVAIKLPDIRRGLSTPVTQGSVLTEAQLDDTDVTDRAGESAPAAPPTAPRGISRRGVLLATGSSVGVLLVTTLGQTVTPLQRIGLFAVRKAEQGPVGVPVNRTAEQAQVMSRANDPGWTLVVTGPSGSQTLDLSDVERLARHQADFPISCVEGWSVGAHWQGLRLLDVVKRVGGHDGSQIRLTSLEQSGSYRVSYVQGPQLSHALLATHLNGVRIDLDHGYPLRLIAPDRAGVLNTKWLSTVEVL